MSGVLSALDWTVIAAYLVFSLAVGVLFTRRAGRSMAEYFISGRNLPWWIAGTSMVATSFASDTPLVVTGWVRSGGIAENWLWWSFAAGGMLSVFLLARLWRRAEVLTDVELTELRYSGRSAAVLRAFRGVYLAGPINCITLAWVMVAMVKLMQVLFGVHPVVAVAVCAGVATLYAVLSGYWGVVVTDLVQFVVAMVGAIVLAAVVVGRLGGLGALASKAPQASVLGERLLAFFPRTGDAAAEAVPFWHGPFFAFVVLITMQWWANKNADGGGVIVQRMLSARDERHALLATLWFNIAHYALRPWPWILVALGSVVVFPDLADGEMAYPAMIKEFLPSGVLGLVVASFLAAFMSTVDTHLNLSSAYLVNDVYRRFAVRSASERHYVLVSRLASVAFMGIAAGIALAFDSISELFKFLLAFSSGVGLVYILRWFWWRINAWSEIAAMLASSVIAGVLYVLKSGVALSWPWPIRLAPLAWPYPVILLVTVAGSTVVWLAVTFMTKPVSEERLVAFYRKVRPYGFWGPIAAQSGVAPARGLGRMLFAWVAGTVMVLAAMLGVGKLLLGEPWSGGAYLAAAAVGAVVVAHEIRSARRLSGPRGSG
ncbi:MAG: sodium:solute symporter family protein [Phycisphaerae bacterium]|nr:sodium:solute symporter family protein [Phycisphaerae bacterium]